MRRRWARSVRLRRHWDKHARSYDRVVGVWDRRVFRDTRTWVCGQATGDTLEVAVGTGLNLPCYPDTVRLTGVDFSPAMLAIARRRATDLGLTADLRDGDAQWLDFPDESFDTVVCTFSLCTIPDLDRAVGEMRRVLRPGGRLLLADHIVARTWPLRAVQRLVELVSIPTGGEHYRRRPLRTVQSAGFAVERRERFGPGGMVERLTARKPETPSPSPAGPSPVG
jgi:ubiquinone/menaquinone biosynthesis C-methylase UbiE